MNRVAAALGARQEENLFLKLRGQLQQLCGQASYVALSRRGRGFSQRALGNRGLPVD
jgi:hypothetical protein